MLVHPEDIVFAAAIVLMLAGCMAATLSSHPLKRVAGVGLALLGATASLGAMRVAGGALIAGVGVAFAMTALGVAIAVRLQESYGADGGDLNADEEARPGERAS